MTQQLSPTLVPDTTETLARAYAEVFTTAYGTMVLRDMAEQCGFTAALPADASDETLRDHNARRAVFGRVFEILRLSSSGRDAIAWAILPSENKETET